MNSTGMEDWQLKVYFLFLVPHILFYLHILNLVLTVLGLPCCSGFSLVVFCFSLRWLLSLHKRSSERSWDTWAQ